MAPIAEPVLWSVSDPVARVVIQAVFWLGWGVLLISTFLINHFELFGLHQVWVKLPRSGDFGTRVPNAAVLPPCSRHPIYVGFLLAFWATPRMTAGHLLFAVACTGYILIGIWFEERDLIALFGERYQTYRAQVGMLVPKLGTRGRKGSAQS